MNPRVIAAGWLLALACASCVGPTSPSSPSSLSRIDVLPFLIGEAQLWPRRGDLSQNQVVDYARREVCWPKHTNPRFFECWRWDDDFVYHEVDHGVDGNTGVSYRFEDGRWMPRYFEPDWRLDVSTQIVWFDPACGVDAVRSGPFRYHQRMWFEAARDGGGDLGTRDTLVLEYAPEDPAGGPSAPERFYFGRGAGWYEWSRGDIRKRFNVVGGPSVNVIREVVCG
jgi:hypothetical protein